LNTETPTTAFSLDADRLAREMDDPRSLNLIMLGFTLSSAQRGDDSHGMLHCSQDDIKAVLKHRLKGKERQLQSSLRALAAGAAGNAAP
jgi:hypothetical protein